MLDGTPLLDIKPYVPEFDSPRKIRTGWLEKARRTVSGRRSDGRFKKKPSPEEDRSGEGS
jgi:tRNA (Thr-GGU) A37 N-methylase